MADERKTILLNGGRKLDVKLVAGASEFLAGLLDGTPAKEDEQEIALTR